MQHDKYWPLETEFISSVNHYFPCRIINDILINIVARQKNMNNNISFTLENTTIVVNTLLHIAKHIFDNKSQQSNNEKVNEFGTIVISVLSSDLMNPDKKNDKTSKSFGEYYIASRDSMDTHLILQLFNIPVKQYMPF